MDLSFGLHSFSQPLWGVTFSSLFFSWPPGQAGMLLLFYCDFLQKTLCWSPAARDSFLSETKTKLVVCCFIFALVVIYSASLEITYTLHTGVSGRTLSFVLVWKSDFVAIKKIISASIGLDKKEKEKMGGHYPPLGIAAVAPSSYALSSRTARMLAPGLVVGTVTILAMCSLIGLSISSSVFASGSPHTRSEGASQAFVLLAVSPLL